MSKILYRFITFSIRKNFILLWSIIFPTFDYILLFFLPLITLSIKVFTFDYIEYQRIWESIGWGTGVVPTVLQGGRLEILIILLVPTALQFM